MLEAGHGVYHGEHGATRDLQCIRLYANQTLIRSCHANAYDINNNTT